MKCLLTTVVVALALFHPPSAVASAACDDCSDLPRLYRELLEQEVVRQQFEQWNAYVPRETIKTLQDRAQATLDTATSAGQTSTTGQGGTPRAGAQLSTDLNSPNCGLLDEHDVPTTPEKVRKKFCKPIADHLLTHEAVHQASCKAAYANHTTNIFRDAGWYVRDDLKAYKAGIDSLRNAIRELAIKCGWKPTRELDEKGNKSVPTPERINELSKNAKAKANLLNHSTRK